MKKAAALLAAVLALAACNTRYEQENDDKGNIIRKTTEKTPFNEYELEMKGNLTFSENGTEITSVPDGGYARYVYNDIAVEARPGRNNTVSITIHEKGEEVSKDSEKGKGYLEDAIGRMQDLQEKHK